MGDFWKLLGCLAIAALNLSYAIQATNPWIQSANLFAVLLALTCVAIMIVNHFKD